MGKKIVWGIVILVVVVIAVVGGVLYFSGDVVKAAVEKLGPEMTKAKVTLDKVDLSLTSGEGSLSGLFVGNPSGLRPPARSSSARSRSRSIPARSPPTPSSSKVSRSTRRT